MSASSIVIVGGGHAAAQLCNLLAEAGLGPRLHLVCEEPHLPYQRPPLSKSFLKAADQALQLHRAETWFAEQGIALHMADAAVAIDRAARTVTLRSGRVLAYGRLVLATGTRARRLPDLPEHLDNVAVLRHAADAAALRTRLAAMRQSAHKLTVLGGGFIGLEIAATARLLGLDVEVLEGAPRLLARSVSPELAVHVLEHHRAAGTSMRLGVRVDGFESDGQRLNSLCVDGVRQDVDHLVLGIGAVPETALAAAAGLAVDNGIVVDAALRSSDPDILALGDCASFPAPDGSRRLRLESVQNANDQARTAAGTLLGRDEAYRATPWFWSEQGSLRLQMAGLLPAQPSSHRRPGANPHSFSIFHYDAARLACVESVNAPLDHMMARRMLDAHRSPDAAQVADPAVALKSLV